MTADIFRVYKSASHGSADESGDRPSLNMSWYEGVLWFGRKHAWHLVPKIVFVGSIPFLVMAFFLSLPSILSGAFDNTVQSSKNEAAAREPAETLILAAEDVVERRDVPSIDSERISPEVRSFGAERGGRDVSNRTILREAVEEVKVEIRKIVMLYQKGVMLDDGRKITVGEAFEYEGKTETLAVACAVCGVIGFELGKRMRL